MTENSHAASSGGVLAVLSGPGRLQDKPKQLQEAYEKWITFQPPWVEGISSGFFGAFQGAFLGTLMGTMAKGSLDQPGVAGANHFNVTNCHGVC